MKPYVGASSSDVLPSANPMDTTVSNDAPSDSDEIEQLHKFDLISEQNSENGATTAIET